MEGRRRVTEEDLHVTEALIADSFARLKHSVAAAPHEAVRPATNMIREHPFAAAAAAAGTGVVAFQILKMVTGGHAHREHEKKVDGRKDLMGQLLSLAAPYIVSTLQQQLGRAMLGQRR